MTEVEQDVKRYFACDKHGYHPDNTASFCAIECGLQFVRMVRLDAPPPVDLDVPWFVWWAK